MKLNLGSGIRKRQGYINIDSEASTKPDVVWNLEETPWKVGDYPGPFVIESESVTEILAHHVLEHLGQATPVFLKVIQEIYRILVPGGTIEIKVPHHRCDSYWGDPTHVRPITTQALSLFSKSNCKMFAEKGWPNTPLATYLNVDLEIVSTHLELTPHWSHNHNKNSMSQSELDYFVNTYWNVVDEVTIMMKKIGV